MMKTGGKTTPDGIEEMNRGIETGRILLPAAAGEKAEHQNWELNTHDHVAAMPKIYF